MRVNPESVARASSHRPWVTIGIWVVVALLAGSAAAAFLGEVLTTEFDFTDDPESKQALSLIEDRLRMTVRRNPFRFFVHHPAAVVSAAAAQGMTLVFSRRIAGWEAVILERV